MIYGNENTKRFISILLLSALLAATASCGSGEALQSGGDTSASGDTTAPVTEAAYEYPTLDLGGGEFVILNTAQTYNFYSTLDLEEATGDPLDDAIYERNRLLEERFNFKLVIDETHKLKEASSALSTSVLSGDDVYDAAFLRDLWMEALLSEKMLYDLSKADGFHFDKPWWDGAAIDACRIGKDQPIYYAYTDISLCDFEGTICVFFNENMMEDLSLDAPYDLVREGKWTLDKMKTYMEAGTNLNGDDSFAFNEKGKSIYGLSGCEHTTNALLPGFGFHYIVKNSDNIPEIAAKGDRFYTGAQKMLEALAVEGNFVFINSSGDSHYEMVFKNNRALLMTAQLKATNIYRDMEASYGIVPMPKLDEEQESYHNLRSYSYVLTIPVTNPALDDTAALMDAMSYLTYETVIDDFYDGRVSQKAMRSEDSIEMLELIRETRYVDMGIAYGWSNPIKEIFYRCSKAASTEFVSSLESVRSGIQAKIDDFMAKQ